MSGISSKASGKLLNKNKFGGKEILSQEFSDGSGLEEYDFSSRNYDLQIGRWMNIDAFSEKAYSLTPYRYCFNNPLLYIDPDGRWEFQVDYKKDKDGNQTSELYLKLVAQKGDDIHSLSKQTGIKERKLEKMKLGELNEKSIITGGMGRLVDFNRINEALNYSPAQCKDQNNCWNMSFEYAEGNRISSDGSYPTVGGATLQLTADGYLTTASNGFENEANPQSGDIMRFSNGQYCVYNEDNTLTCTPIDPKSKGGTSHYAIFLLNNDKGTQVFTKNGANADNYRVQYTTEKTSSSADHTLLQAYGNPVGVGNGKSPYYRKN